VIFTEWVVRRPKWAGLRQSMLGGIVMSQRVFCPQSPNPEEGSHQLQQLLREALELVDNLGLPPEIGARLQEVIDLVDGYFGDVS
jgi:hypothetical protein